MPPFCPFERVLGSSSLNIPNIPCRTLLIPFTTHPYRTRRFLQSGPLAAWIVPSGPMGPLDMQLEGFTAGVRYFFVGKGGRSVRHGMYE